LICDVEKVVATRFVGMVGILPLRLVTWDVAELREAEPVVGGTVATGVTSNLIYLPTSEDSKTYALEVAPLIFPYVPFEVVDSSHLNVETPSGTEFT
jgi:hypothetical protein